MGCGGCRKKALYILFIFCYTALMVKLFIVTQQPNTYSDVEITTIVEAENDQQARSRYRQWFDDAGYKADRYYDEDVNPFPVYEGMVVQV